MIGWLPEHRVALSLVGDDVIDLPRWPGLALPLAVGTLGPLVAEIF